MTVGEHAQTVREALDYHHTEIQFPEAIPALDALVALAEQLQQERDEAREERDAHLVNWHRLVDDHLAAEAQAETYRAALRQIANLGSPRTALENRDLARAALAGHAPEPGDET